MTQSLALNVLSVVLAGAALPASVHYFLLRKPAAESRADPSRILGLHPRLLAQTIIAGAMAWGCALLSNALVAHGYRFFAGLTLAVSAPAWIALGLFVLSLLLLGVGWLLGAKRSVDKREPVAVLPRHRIATWVIFSAVIISAALIPIFR